MIRACIDIGSNSVLLLVAEVDGEIKKEILNCSFVTSLGRDLDKTGVFHPESMEATFDALREYRKQLEKINFNLFDVIVTATEAARVANNSTEFFKKVKNEIGFNVTIITGEGEAYYTALGVVSSISNEENNFTIMDIGGASTELIKLSVSPFVILNSISLPVGSVRATDWKKEHTFDEKMKSILSNDFTAYETATLLCVAGSMTSLASMFLGRKIYSDKEIEGITISFNEFIKFSNALQFTNTQELLLNFPFLGKRAQMVTAGAEVANLLGQILKINKIQISTRGLRYGVLLEGEIHERFKIK